MNEQAAIVTEVERGYQEPAHDVWFEPHGEHGPETRCACGWKKRHPRAKVRDRAAAAHLARSGVLHARDGV